VNRQARDLQKSLQSGQNHSNPSPPSKNPRIRDYREVYRDVQKLALIMNAPKGSVPGLPLFFACVLDDQPKPQPTGFVEKKFLQPLLNDAKTWPTYWRKPSVLVTAPISAGPEDQWCCYLIEGGTDWKPRIVAQFSSESGMEHEKGIPRRLESSKSSTNRHSQTRMDEQQLLQNSSSRCKEFYFGLREIARSQPFNHSDFTKSGYTFRYNDGRNSPLSFTLSPDFVSMNSDPDDPDRFPGVNAFWSRVATIPAFKDKMRMNHPGTQLNDESWSHDDVVGFLGALKMLADPHKGLE
jgi:hypothetical protein